MTKSILTIAITILALSTSAALAAHRTHHRHAMYANAGSPVVSPGGAGNSDFMRNLRDSGYNKKNDYDKNGILITQ